jgi:hypothetical protein
MKTLVALLGRSPGTVTATFYALQEAGYGVMDRIVSLTTDDRPADHCERLICEEIENWRNKREEETGRRPIKPIFEPKRIAARDLEDEASTDEFQTKLDEILYAEIEAGNEVYLGLAGGRKSMAALAAIVAKFINSDRLKMFHLYLTDRELERRGDVNELLLDMNLKRRAMHPSPKDYVLVEVSYNLESRMNDFLYRQVRRQVERDPKWLLSLPDPIKENLWGYHYEVKVAEHIGPTGSAPRKYRFDCAWAHYPLRDRNRTPLRGVPPLDIYAERDEGERLRVLIGECKLSLSEQADEERLRKGLGQLRAYKQKIEDFVQNLKDCPIVFERWLITNAPQVPQSILDRAKAEGVQVMYARTPRNWRTNVDWQVDRLRLIEPL